MSCEYCGTQNTVPQDVWEQFMPKAPARPASPYGGPPPAAGQSLPLPPRRTQSSKAIVIIVIVFIAIMFAGVIIPILVGFCGACVAIFGGVAATTASKSKGPESTETWPEPVSVTSTSSSFSSYASADDVTPSLDRADVHATADNVFRAVREKWNEDAVLGQAVLSRVRSDGTADLSSGEAAIMLTFYAQADPAAGQGTLENGRLQVVVSKGMVMEAQADVDVSALRSTALLDGMPECTIKELWKEALKEGYPESGEATIVFPYPPTVSSAKKKKKDAYSYLFTVEGGAAGKPINFLLEDCKAK